MLTSLDAIAGKTLTIDQAALGQRLGKVNIGYYGAATIVLLSDGENTSGPDPVAWPGSRRWPACTSNRSGSARPPARRCRSADSAWPRPWTATC